MSEPIDVDITYRLALNIQELRLVHKGLREVWEMECEDSADAQKLARKLAASRVRGFKARLVGAEKLLKNIDAEGGDE